MLAAVLLLAAAVPAVSTAAGGPAGDEDSPTIEATKAAATAVRLRSSLRGFEGSHRPSQPQRRRRPPPAPIPSAGFRIPNIVHYVLANRRPRPFPWTAYLSARAAVDRLRPDRLIYHLLDAVQPTGPWWEAARGLAVPSEEGPGLVELIPYSLDEVPSPTSGAKLSRPEFVSDFMRIQVLLQAGGVYLDTDHVPLRPFDDLRRSHGSVWGRQTEDRHRVAVGCILAEPNSTTLRELLALMRRRYDGEWGHHSVDVADAYLGPGRDDAWVLGYPRMFPFGWAPDQLLRSNASLLKGSGFDFTHQPAFGPYGAPAPAGPVYAIHLFGSQLGRAVRHFRCADIVPPTTNFAAAVHLAVDNVTDLCRRLDAVYHRSSLVSRLWPT